MEAAVRHHRSGQLEQAAELYREVLQNEPDNPVALHSLAMLAHRSGRSDTAVELLGRAIAVNPQVPQLHYCIGIAFETIGRPEEAIVAYRQAVSLNPEYFEARNKTVNLLLRLGRLTEALEQTEQAASITPDNAHAHHLRGFVLQVLGRYPEATESFRQAVGLKQDFAEAYNHLGVTLASQNRYDEAIESYEKAIALDPAYADSYNNLAIAFGIQGRRDEAVANYKRALQIEPDLVDALYNLANILQGQGLHDEAIANYRRTIELRPDYAEAHNNLSRSLKECGRLNEAIESCRQAIALRPDMAEAYNNMGLLLRALGHYIEAIENFEKAIELNPDYANAHWNYSLALLASERFTEGWKEYQWRRKTDMEAILDSQRREPSTWDGSSFEGKKLLIRYEQGMGDNIQFVRYAPMVKARGGTVIFETLKPLLGILKDFEGIDELVEASPDGNPTTQFDLHAFTLDLPGIFGTTVDTIPVNVPYLFADEVKTEYWRNKLADNCFKAGLAWAGSARHTNDRNRSCDLSLFAPLSKIKDVRLYGLQKGPAAAQIEQVGRMVAVENLGEQFEDFADTAAVIENLDIVISVDTAVLHLAGAMGKKVWALLPFEADWRWMLNRHDSPWYPAMKLFRQTRAGDWDEVFRRLAEELNTAVSEWRQSCGS